MMVAWRLTQHVPLGHVASRHARLLGHRRRDRRLPPRALGSHRLAPRGRRLGHRRRDRLRDGAPTAPTGPAELAARYYSIYLIRINVVANRLTHAAGVAIASALRENKTVTACDASRNAIDDAAGAEIALGVRKNPVLTSLNLNKNMLGPETGRAFSSTLKRNKFLRYLHLADNDLGPQASTFGAVVVVVEIAPARLVHAAARRGEGLIRRAWRGRRGCDRPPQSPHRI